MIGLVTNRVERGLKRMKNAHPHVAQTRRRALSLVRRASPGRASRAQDQAGCTSEVHAGQRDALSGIAERHFGQSCVLAGAAGGGGISLFI